MGAVKRAAIVVISVFIGVVEAQEGLNNLQFEPYQSPVISIIIDDLGEQLDVGLRIVMLPANITCAMLPHRSHTSYLAEVAHIQDKEVMLHLPMEALGQNKLGKGGLTLAMSYQEFINTVQDNIASIPYVSGINNHMGSLLTQYSTRMQWLMQEIENQGLFFVDSRTTEHSMALVAATQNKIPSLRRDIFLDDDPSPAAITRQMQALIRKALTTGNAVAIGHPHPSTLAALEYWLPIIQQIGIEVVPVSQQIKQAMIHNRSPALIAAQSSLSNEAL